MHLPLVDGDGLGKHTETAATLILDLLPPKEGCRTVLTRYNYTPGANSHTVTVMKSIKRVKLYAAAAAGTAIVLNEDPGSIAANDYLVIKLGDGTYGLHKVSAKTVNADGTVSVTLATALAAAAVDDASVWFMGIASDHTARVFDLPTGSTTDLSDAVAGVVAGGVNEPLVTSSNNVTAAGTLNYVRWAHAHADM
jgi:hypothetical protein